MEESRKRKGEDGSGESSNKKAKVNHLDQHGPKQWRVVRKGEKDSGPAASSLEPGDMGIWVTCDMHKEGKCIAELRDLFSEYAEKLYGDSIGDNGAAQDKDRTAVDIEADIKGEIEGMQQKTRLALFQPIRVDVKCVVFFKTQHPIEPVAFVHKICTDARHSASRKRSRFIKRLTPVTLLGKATEKGLEEVAKAVLAPHFHQEGSTSRKFAIRTTIRQHTTLTRDSVIKQVADGVGSPHTVDLKHYDLLILVEIYKNLCGMSVVSGDFDELKRYNLAEIYDLSVTKAAGRPDAT